MLMHRQKELYKTIISGPEYTGLWIANKTLNCYTAVGYSGPLPNDNRTTSIAQMSS